MYLLFTDDADKIPLDLIGVFSSTILLNLLVDSL